MPAVDSTNSKKGGTFGTFGGVFTPCTLTILGVIMFLRFGQVVGRAGLVYAVAIVLAANAITLLTSLSLSAIATNTRVKGGGAYYLISRSLGVEFGGAIGIVFFLAQAISVALYVIGFTEAIVDTFPLAKAPLRRRRHRRQRRHLRLRLHRRRLDDQGPVRDSGGARRRAGVVLRRRVPRLRPADSPAEHPVPISSRATTSLPSSRCSFPR